MKYFYSIVTFNLIVILFILITIVVIIYALQIRHYDYYVVTS